MSLSTERLCRCFDGDFCYVLKGTKGKQVGVTSDSPPCFYHSSAVPRVSLAKNCGFKKWVGRENVFPLSKKIRRSRRKLWLSWLVCCYIKFIQEDEDIDAMFFLPLRTDYLQSQFYTGVRKAADTALNQEARLLWSVGKQRMSSMLKHQHTSTSKNKSSSFKMAQKCHILSTKG